MILVRVRVRRVPNIHMNAGVVRAAHHVHFTTSNGDRGIAHETRGLQACGDGIRLGISRMFPFICHCMAVTLAVPTARGLPFAAMATGIAT